MIKGAFNRLADILSGNNQLIIPDLQRDYCWGDTIPKNRKTSLAYNFTRDLVAEAETNRSIEEYSYGILYTYEYPTSFLYLCDGQQRLTTLYLILGVANCYGDAGRMRNLLQLRNLQPRLKYEVRNSTDQFMKDLLYEGFLKQCLSDIADVTSANWFRDEYKNDPSIISISCALENICKLVNEKNAESVGRYLMEKAGFVYINLESNDKVEEGNYIAIREYGEKMYEIVNTCGDPMEKNEHQKSLLLSQLPEHLRKDGTEKWEIWQDFFWQNRATGQLSADEGFNTFLEWIEEIEGNKELTVEMVEGYFKAFFLMVSVQSELSGFRKFEIVNLRDEFLANNKPEPVVLYPCLISLFNTDLVYFDGAGYRVNFKQVNYDNLFRFVRFFSNVSKKTDAKLESTRLAKMFDKGVDVVDFLLVDSNVPSVLSDEELLKLGKYRNCKDENERRDLEDRIWRAEDHRYLHGSIRPLLKCMGITSTSSDFDIALFSLTYRLFDDLVNEENIEKLRLAMLATDFDAFHEGWSWGNMRYYLGLSHDEKFWREYIADTLFQEIFAQVSKGISLETIIERLQQEQKDENKKKIVAFLLNESLAWPWNVSKRFFMHNRNICLPHGVQAKSNTKQVEIL